MMNRFVPTEKECVRLIEETTRNGNALDMNFGPRGAWIEWEEGTPEPWSVAFVQRLRGVPLVGCDGDGI